MELQEVIDDLGVVETGSSTLADGGEVEVVILESSSSAGLRLGHALRKHFAAVGLYLIGPADGPVWLRAVGRVDSVVVEAV